MISTIMQAGDANMKIGIAEQASAFYTRFGIIGVIFQFIAGALFFALIGLIAIKAFSGGGGGGMGGMGGMSRMKVGKVLGALILVANIPTAALVIEKVSNLVGTAAEDQIVNNDDVNSAVDGSNTGAVPPGAGGESGG